MLVTNSALLLLLARFLAFSATVLDACILSSLVQDSGGPVWSYESGRFVQWGIISHALGTTALPCDGQYPTMLMRTSYYKHWVETIVGKLH